jgi:hypothetical protein
MAKYISTALCNSSLPSCTPYLTNMYRQHGEQHPPTVPPSLCFPTSLHPFHHRTAQRSLAYPHLTLQTRDIDIYVTACRSDYCSHRGPTSIHPPYNSDLQSFCIPLIRASLLHLFHSHCHSRFVLFRCTQYFPSSSPKFGDLIFKKKTYSQAATSLRSRTSHLPFLPSLLNLFLRLLWTRPLVCMP